MRGMNPYGSVCLKIALREACLASATMSLRITLQLIKMDKPLTFTSPSLEDEHGLSRAAIHRCCWNYSQKHTV